MSPDPISSERGDTTAPLSNSVTEPLEQVIALAEEVLQVSKRTVETGRVRVSVTTETAEELVRQTLRTRRAEIERVTLGHEVREIPQTREEDGVLIVPVVEEILVIEKRLILKEEIRLRFFDSEDTVEQTVERRVQSALVERLPPSEAGTVPPAETMAINGNNKDTTP